MAYINITNFINFSIYIVRNISTSYFVHPVRNIIGNVSTSNFVNSIGNVIGMQALASLTRLRRFCGTQKAEKI
jgi:hypothetical protein